MIFRRILWSCLSMPFFSACQQAETEILESDDLRMSIVASIKQQSQAPMSRLVGNTPSSVEFGSSDEIGVFIDDGTFSKWTYKDSKWDPEKTVFWPDKIDEHTFYAFYPYAFSESAESVPMPDLSVQDGSFDRVKELDFLTASVSQFYGADGVVDFVRNPFVHLSSLIKLTISAESDLTGSILKSIQITGEDITSTTTYSLLDDEKTVVEESNQLIVTVDAEMTSADVDYYVLVNPKSDDSLVTLCIEYERGGKTYEATKEDFASNVFKSGVMQAFNIVVKDGVLTITGSSVSPWQTDDEELEDLIITGKEQ